MTAVAMVIRTNVDGKSIPDDFLNTLTGYVVKAFKTEPKYVSVELHTGVQLRQTGSPGARMTIDVHHNVARVTPREKHRLASDIAKFTSVQIEMQEDRVLVLFFDTRKCT